MRRIIMIKFLIALVCIMSISIGFLGVKPAMGQIVYEYNFEPGWDGWGADYGVWEVGTPTAGPDSCHGGANCAGTVLGGNYPADTDSRLISPSIMLPAVSGNEELHLRFWHWFSYSTSDAGYVQISVYDETAGEWSDWATIGNSLVDNTPAWSLMNVELTDYADERVRIAFYHTARHYYESTGWYVDDIRIIKRVPEFTGSFETGWGDWSGDRGVWEVGTPTAGPDSCHGGANCAGTVLGGNYPADTDSRLISPSIMLPAVSGNEELHLRFWHWFSYSTSDAGYVQISVYDETAGEWSDWATIGNPIVNSSAVWSPSPLFELTDYADEKVRIAFYHTARHYYESTGWYIDDVIIEAPFRCFADVPPGHWAEEYICRIYDEGITTGCGGSNYCPNDDVTREQMAAFIVRAKEGEPPADYCDTGSPFTDVSPDTWPCKYIKRLLELGITKGCGAGIYCPDRSVTRAEMAAFIIRAVEGEPPANYCDSGSPFSDVPANTWPCKYIKRLLELEITKGCGPGIYCPDRNVTRAEMAAFLARAFLGMN